ncbi:MAG: hypothetical protein U1E05_14790, partial [Patescibacteria group bacterium]|nr:hypothetical protein [Patescibacteria group bacterium]
DWLTTLGGGEFRLLGHATQVADVAMFGLANAAGTGIHGYSGGNSGGFGTVTVIPDGDLSTLRTSLTFNEAQRFDSTGERNSVWLLRGAGLASLPGTYSASGAYTPNAANPKDGLVFITLPRFTGGATFNANGLVLSGVGYGAVHGAPGTPVVPVRGDLLGAVSPTATEGDFVTIDITGTGATNRTGVRVLQASEYTTSLAGAINAVTGLNVRASGALAVTGDTRFQVLKLDNGSSVTVSGTLPNLTQPSQLVLNAGGILVPSGVTAAINATGPAIVRTAGGVSAYVHAFGDLNVNGEFFSDLGLVKTGVGTATFAAGSLTNLRGRVVVHEGPVNINDSLANIRDWGIIATGYSGQTFSATHLELNHGTLDINGNDQLFGRFESGNILAGAATQGGTLTSSTAARVTLMHGGTFSGQITGPISLDKVGNNTWTLTNSSPVSGDMTIRQGTVLLRDQGALPNVGQFDLNYARLDVDNGWLEAAGYVDRLKNGVTLNMRGGDFVNRGRAGTLTQEHLGTVNLLQGQNLIQTLAGGGGATETYIANLVRSPGATVSFQQSYGFMGTAGNDSTAIRYLPALINGSAPTLVNNILPPWMIVNNDHFATWNPTTGISWLGNTEDGYANYDSTDLGTAAATHNVNDGTARTLSASKTVNSFRHTGNIMNLGGFTLTLDTGGLLSRSSSNVISNGLLTSNSGELNVFVNDNMTISAAITGNIALTKAGNATLTLSGNNNYTGATHFTGHGSASGRGGLVNLNTAGADGNTVFAVPGDLHIHHTTVTELLPNQIKNTANVSLYGGAILNLRDAASVNETISSLNFTEGGGGDANNGALVTRPSIQNTSTLNLTGATAISSTNYNPVSTPTIYGNVGTVAFTRGDGSPQTLLVNSPTALNGLAAAGLTINARIGAVPTGVPEGGLIKAGDGLLLLAPSYSIGGLAINSGNTTLTVPSTAYLSVGMPVVSQDIPGGTYIASIASGSTIVLSSAPTSTATGRTVLFGHIATNGFGNPSEPTDVFNIQSGIVHAMFPTALGGNNARTTVQSGAVLLLNGVGFNAVNSASAINGSLRLKDGATLGLMISSTTLGAVGSTGTVDVASGATVDVQLRDYFVPSTNTANIVINHKLTGSGTINLTGIEYAAGYNGGGLFQLRNTANDFSGTIRVNTNAVLEANSNTGSSGKTFGTATIELAGGVLRVRDNNSVNYGNNVTLSADSMIDVDRQSANSNNTIAFGRLTLSGPAGTKHVLSTPYGQGHPIAANGFRVAFTDVDGAATLVKGGTRFIDLNGYAAGFSGNIEVAGPIGLNLSTSGNLVLNAATNTINNLTIGGFHTFAGAKTVNINNTLLVSDNAGQVLNGWAGEDTGGIVGSVLVASGATVNATNLTNHGLVSSSGGAASISATTLAGTGRYFTFGTTGSPQNLTVTGRLADDGATPTTLTVAGTNTTTIVPTASGTSTGGTQVQKGVLRVAPTASVANPLGSGDIKVYGWNATAAGTFSQPVAGNAAELRFDGGANPITQDSNIANHGLVRVTAGGNVTINGSIAGSAATSMTAASFFDNTIPGLLEGRITTTTGQPDTVTSASDFGTGRVANNGSFGVWLEPRMGQMNVVTQDPRTGWSDNTTWIYTGYFYDADGVFAFAENIDDNVMISIDGVTRLNNSGPNITSTATKTGQRGATEALNSNTANVADLITAAQPLAANPNLPAGWHALEIRFYNGTGGAGPYGVSNGFTNNYGFGFNPNGTMALDGTQFFRPIDPGDGTLFRTAVYGKGDIQVDAGATLNVAKITATNQLALAAAGLGGIARVTGGTHGNTSDVDSLVITGASGSATIITDPAVTLTTANLALAAGTTLNKAGAGDLVVNGGNPGLGTGSTLAATAGRVLVNGVQQGAGGLVRVDNGATLGGTGTIQSSVIVNFGGTHAPGASVGSQTVGGETWMAGGRFEFELNDAAGTAGGPNGWDLLTIANGTSTGTLDISDLSESNRFMIDIVSLAGTAPGSAAHFNPTVPIEWEFVTYEQLVGTFSPDLFELDHSRFTNNLGAGHFGIVQTEFGLAIAFIPEPSTLLMCAATLLLLLVRRRR